jgi:plasmid maintenance system antidote protein VapI
MPGTNRDLDHEYESPHSRIKVRQSGRGRRANIIHDTENPLGSFLQSMMERRGITQTDFARMLDLSRDKVRRLISRNAIEIQSWIAERIVQVLGLSDAEREEFSRLMTANRQVESLTQTLPEEGTGPIASVAPHEVWLSLPSASPSFDVPLKGKRDTNEKQVSKRGRKAVEPLTDIGRFLEDHLRENGMRRSDLAKAIEVAPSTITRFMQGNTAAIREETKERICRELGLDTSARLEFDRLTAHELQVAITVHKFTSIDLDELAKNLHELQGFYERGLADFVLLEAHRLYLFLKRAEFSKSERRALDLQWRFGMLRGSANEAAVQWDDRVIPTIAFYNELEEEIKLRGIQEDLSKIYIAHIQTRRAPLYRQLNKYQQSLREFTEALDVYAHYLDTSEDRRLLVELYYSRAHVYAVQGMKERWEKDIERARMRAEEEKDEKRRRELVGLVVYTEGEGYKRLAFNEERAFSKETREEFARKGLALFGISHMEESKWVGHGILNGVARAECMALIDPAAALKEAERLRTEATRSYPSIVQKIDRVITYARQRLQ